MTSRPFRFGVVAPLRSGPGIAPSDLKANWDRLARTVESAGFATLLVPDTIHTLAALPSCAMAAGATSKLHAGTYVLSVANRRPELVAHDALALHQLTGGRFELGLGAGRPSAEVDAKALGMPFGSPAERLRQLAATVQAVRDKVPELPILIAGSGPKLLQLAGQVADIVAFGLAPEATAQDLQKAVDRATSGADGRDVEYSLNLLCVGDEPPPYLARYLNIDVPALIAHHSVSVLTGSVTEMVDTLGGLRDRCGISYICAGSAFIEQLSPVVAQLAGH